MSVWIPSLTLLLFFFDCFSNNAGRKYKNFYLSHPFLKGDSEINGHIAWSRRQKINLFCQSRTIGSPSRKFFKMFTHCTIWGQLHYVNSVTKKKKKTELMIFTLCSPEAMWYAGREHELVIFMWSPLDIFTAWKFLFCYILVIVFSVTELTLEFSTIHVFHFLTHRCAN